MKAMTYTLNKCSFIFSDEKNLQYERLDNLSTYIGSIKSDIKEENDKKVLIRSNSRSLVLFSIGILSPILLFLRQDISDYAKSLRAESSIFVEIFGTIISSDFLLLAFILLFVLMYFSNVGRMVRATENRVKGINENINRHLYER